MYYSITMRIDFLATSFGMCRSPTPRDILGHVDLSGAWWVLSRTKHYSIMSFRMLRDSIGCSPSRPSLAKHIHIDWYYSFDFARVSSGVNQQSPENNTDEGRLAIVLSNKTALEHHTLQQTCTQLKQTTLGYPTTSSNPHNPHMCQPPDPSLITQVFWNIQTAWYSVVSVLVGKHCAWHSLIRRERCDRDSREIKSIYL